MCFSVFSTVFLLLRMSNNPPVREQTRLEGSVGGFEGQMFVLVCASGIWVSEFGVLLYFDGFLAWERSTCLCHVAFWFGYRWSFGEISYHSWIVIHLAVFASSARPKKEC